MFITDKLYKERKITMIKAYGRRPAEQENMKTNSDN
jgi:hypothetical protein